MAPCWARPVSTTRDVSGSAQASQGTGAARGSRSPDATVTVVPRDRPAARGAAVAAVTPGVTATGTPRAARAAASSAPREQTKGSPALSRTTRSPAPARAASRSAMASVGHAGPSGVRPT